MGIIFRLLSGVGAFAHVADVIGGAFLKFGKGSSKVGFGSARIAGSLVIAGILLACGGVAVVSGNEGAANPTPTSYTVTELASNPDLGGKVYARVIAVLAEDYVRVTKSGTYQYSEYIIGDADSGKCLIVKSSTSEELMSLRAGTTGKVEFTGMLRNDQKEIKEAIDTLGSNASPYDINRSMILVDGSKPADPSTMYTIAAIVGAIAALLLLGWAIGFLVFRAARMAPAMSGVGLMEEGVPVRFTGLIPAMPFGIRAREMSAQLRLPPSLTPEAQTGIPPLDLVYKVKGGALRGLRLTPGITAATIGRAWPLKGSKPAIRLKFEKKNVILTFDNEQARDQAFEQVRLSSGLTRSADGLTLS